MLKLNELKEGVLYKAKGTSYIFAVIGGKLHSDGGRAGGDASKARAMMNPAMSAPYEGRMNGCRWIEPQAAFTILEEVTANGASITQGVATMKEGQVYSVNLLTGKKITVDETVKGKVVVIGGTTYRLGKKDEKTGVRKLRPLKSKISTATEPQPVA